MIREEKGYALGQAIFIAFIAALFFSIAMLLYAADKKINGKIMNDEISSLNRVSHHRFICDRINAIPLSKLIDFGIEQVLNEMKMTTRFYPFGHFIRYESTYQKGKMNRHEYGLIANCQTRGFDSTFSLVLTDSLHPFTVTGQTRVSGNILSPVGPLKEITFQGWQNRVFSPRGGDVKQMEKNIHPGSGLIKETLKSIKNMPYSEKLFIEENRLYLNEGKIYASQLSEASIKSISGPGVIVSDRELPGFQYLELRNYIILFSPDSLLIGPEVFSSQVLFIAEEKIVAKGGIHASQFIAPKILLSGTKLYFPTVISSIPGRDTWMNLSGEINGSIFQYPPKRRSATIQNQMFMHRNLRLNGLLYCGASARPGGEIHGTVILNNTMLYRAPTHFINRLDTITISPSYRAKLYPFSRQSTNRVAIVQFTQNSLENRKFSQTQYTNFLQPINP